MISLAIFPCRFTDSARIIGELSYTMSIPVYTDQMILTEMSDQRDIDIDNLQKRLFNWANRTSCAGMEKEFLIELVQDRMDSLQASETDYLYYGFFASLIDLSHGMPHRLLIYSNKNCRVQRGMLMEKLTEHQAREIVREHDRKAACWSTFLFDRDPYDPDLFDTIVRYESQDLFDVVAYVCVVFENHVLQCTPQLCGSLYCA